MKSLSIYVKLIIYFLVVALLPMLGVSLLAYGKLNDVIRTDNRRMLRGIAVDTAYKIEHEIRQRMLEVQAWAELPATIEAARDRSGQKMSELFDRLITTLPTYDLLLLLDGDNRILAANTLSPKGEPLKAGLLRGKPWSGDERIGDARSQPHPSGFWRSALLRELYGGSGYCLTVVVPVTNSSRHIIGKMVAYIGWEHFQDILDVVQDSLVDDFSGTVFLIETDTHRLIGHRNRALYGEPYLAGINLVRQVRSDRDGIFEYKWPVLKTIGYAQVRMPENAPALPWLVCVEVANDVIYAEANFLRGLFVFLTVVAALFIVVVVYFISRRFTKPILQLVDGAQAIADGNLEAKVGVDREDEIGILAKAFNQMSSAIRERDEELKSTNLQLLEANRLKSQFLANMSHELRTPMNSVIGFTTLTLQRAGNLLPEQYRENLVKVRKNALHLLGLLNSILDLSKIEAGSIEVTPEDFSLRNLIDQCLANITPLSEEKRLEMKITYPKTDVPLHQDRQKLQQILINLLANAVKFTPHGHIGIGFEQSANDGAAETLHPTVRIWVDDTGVGIREEDLPHIFSEFVQVGGPAARRSSGTGLGLAISKKLANLLGGDIFVKSEPDHGSTFTVVIPLRHAKGARKDGADK